jgi:predicted porin
MQVGLNLGYKGFKIAGSYADLGKSGVAKTLTSGNRKTKFWDAAVSYKYNALGVSVSYFESKRGGFAKAPSTTVANAKANKYTAWSFGVDYKLAPGFMPYAEYTAFKTNDVNRSNVDPSDNSIDAKGHVFLAGTKLEF